MSVIARGGYQIVDFNNVVITNSGYVLVPGISEKVLNSDKKPLCIANLILHTTDMDPDSNVSIPCQYIEPVYAEMPMPNYQFSVKTVQFSLCLL